MSEFSYRDQDPIGSLFDRLSSMEPGALYNSMRSQEPADFQRRVGRLPPLVAAPIGPRHSMKTPEKQISRVPRNPPTTGKRHRAASVKPLNAVQILDWIASHSRGSGSDLSDTETPESLIQQREEARAAQIQAELRAEQAELSLRRFDARMDEMIFQSWQAWQLLNTQEEQAEQLANHLRGCSIQPTETVEVAGQNP